MFAAGRAWEQVRNSVAYPGLNVKVVGSHGGLSVGEDGATHQCIEDLAIMRAIPNMTVLCPCDGYEMREAVRALLAYEGPAYMRLGRLAVETVTDRVEGYQFAIGKGALLRDGQDVTVVAVGMMVQMALQAAEQLAGEGISVRVIDMHTLKPPGYRDPFDSSTGDRLCCNDRGSQRDWGLGQRGGGISFVCMPGSCCPSRCGG